MKNFFRVLAFIFWGAAAITGFVLWSTLHDLGFVFALVSWAGGFTVGAVYYAIFNIQDNQDDLRKDQNVILANQQMILRKLDGTESKATAPAVHKTAAPAPAPKPAPAEPVTLQPKPAGTSVQPIARPEGTIVCPVCGKEQKAERNCCYNCGVSFI